MELKKNSVQATLGEVPYTTTITAGGHVLYVDEPVESGGSGKGPKAHDLLLAALISCTSVTVKMYANRKGWDVKEVFVDAVMERSVESGVQTTGVIQKISFKGDLDDEQKARLLFIAGKCPVHKTLSPAMDIVTKLG